MPLTTAKEKWLSLAARTKAILLATVTLATIVATVWVIDARYAKAGEFKTLQQEIYEERITEQIKVIEDRKSQTNCRDPQNKKDCDWLDQRIQYWEQQLQRLQQKR